MSAVNLLGEDLFLWNEFQNGNADAFGALMRIHYQDLFYYGTRFTKDETLVKDCLQELFLELWTDRLSVSENTFVKYYLLKTLRRRLSRRNGRSRYTESWEELHFESIFNSSHYIETGPIREDNLAALTRKMRKALVSLSKRQQEVLYLRYYMDADPEEIAEIMCMNRLSAYNLLHEGLRKLNYLRANRFDG